MINHDKILVNIFFGKKYINPNKTKKLSQYPNISNYIANRYKDSSSRNETFWRMKYHIEKKANLQVMWRYGHIHKQDKKIVQRFLLCKMCSELSRN